NIRGLHSNTRLTPLTGYGMVEQLSPRRASASVEAAPTRVAALSAEAKQRHQTEAVVVVDFGSQYSMLNAWRVREGRGYSELVAPDASWEQVRDLNPRGVILSGGPASVYDPSAPVIPDWVFDQELPVLGICYGMQALAKQLGGR